MNPHLQWKSSIIEICTFATKEMFIFLANSILPSIILSISIPYLSDILSCSFTQWDCYFILFSQRGWSWLRVPASGHQISKFAGAEEDITHITPKLYRWKSVMLNLAKEIACTVKIDVSKRRDQMNILYYVHVKKLYVEQDEPSAEVFFCRRIAFFKCCVLQIL